MDSRRGEDGEAPSEITLAEWRVQPSLNRLTRGEVTVRIEPKLMDVLLFLAQRAGQVVSKDQIADAVWPELFISESVITRAIAGLRRALEDDAQSPRFIETIAKRGYRLLIPPAVSTPLAPSPSYAVGQWVRGERFYGRSAEIAEILDGPRNGVWLLGTRAIGKTSMLKQLEYLTTSVTTSMTASGERGYFPIFWDLQGSVEPDALNEDFLAALADAEDRLEALGVRLEDVKGDDLFASLGRLRRALRAQGRTLLLLWDEVEELIHLQAKDPALLRKLRRALQSQEGIRTVMASGPRLWKLAEQRDDTSPFLHGFAPPLYLGPLRDEAARKLVGRACAFDDGRIERILRSCGNHPSLLQMVCARACETGDLERALESVGTDPTIRYFFAVDFDLLTSAEQEVALALARSETGLDPAALLHLQQLGWVRRSGEDRLDQMEIASPILRQWLREKADQKL